MASEMLYPVMPLYLKSIGFSIIGIGLLEGFAEAFAGFSKGYFGKLSDQSGRRVPFVQLGYALSALSKPLMALFVFPAWVFVIRTLDRLGKGIRNGARDALLSDEATQDTKGRIFGFHRSMDTLGAVLGPTVALCYLYVYPLQYKQLFYWAVIPGLLAVLASAFLKDNSKKVSAIPFRTVSFFSFINYWKVSTKAYKSILIGFLFFVLINSSDVFLLLKAKQAGISDTVVIMLYIFYNLVFAVFAFPLGNLSDKVGFKKVFIIGLFMFAIVYLGISFINNLYGFVFLFFVYGLYAAATEGITKAWISNVADKKDTATAIGTYASFQSVFALLASTLAGLIWYNFGPAAIFLMSGTAALILIFYFAFFVAQQPKNEQPTIV